MSDVFYNEKDVERFWSHIDIRGDDDCWICDLSKDEDGYSRIKIRNNKKIYLVRSHRFSYMLAYGEIPDGMMILHSCDNPPCVNPKHLRVGTAIENTKDRESRNRHKHLGTTMGEDCHFTKIKESDVPIIRDLYEKSTLTLKEIGNMYGVGERTIYDIATGVNWGYIDGVVRSRRPPIRKLKEQDIIEIRRLYSIGTPLSEISKKYDTVSKQNIKHILNGTTWKWVNNDNN